MLRTSSFFLLAGLLPCLAFATACGDSGDGQGGDGGQGGGGGSPTTSTGGMGGGGAGGGLPDQCFPTKLTSQESIEATCGVFVRAGATGGDGSKDKPLGSLVEALTMGNVVYVCAAPDALNEAVTVNDDKLIFGGLACADWKYTAEKTKLTAPENQVPLRIQGNTSTVTFDDFEVTASNATTPGLSSIGIFIDAATVSLSRVDISAGNGAPGMPGADGGAQAAAAPGGNTGAAAGTVPPSGGPASTTNTCPDGDSNGGKGGEGGLAANSSGANGNSGDLGTGADPGFGEVVAGWGCDTLPTGGLGRNGTPGTSLGPGVGALTSQYGGLSSAAYTNASGTDGSDGTRGKGGGGGGGSKATAAVNGAGGGSGGAGGCGGLKGTAGGGAGSSLGIVSFNATVTLQDVSVSLGAGGVGGKGGNGQLGQPGGTFGGGGAAGAPNAGCAGGAGGRGGHGSSAGGGRGGHALGVLFSGTAPAGTPTLTAPGSAGMGGMGGANGIDNATAGADGTVAPSQQAAAQ